MDAEYGEVETSGQIAGKTFYDFHLFDSVEGAGNAACRYGEIAVPVDFLASYSDARGIHIHIPYVADIRLLKVRIAMKSGSGGVEYVRGAVDGRHWFPVMRTKTGQGRRSPPPRFMP